MSIEIHLAGSVSIESDGVPRSHLSSPRTQVAFVRLTMERDRGTTRDQLADTLWPEGLPNTWASALRSVVSRVRAFVATALPAGATSLVAEAGRYVLWLPSDAVVDVERAQAAGAAAQEALAAGRHAAARELASRAVSCLRAPFLPDHDGEWVAGVRQHLADALLTGLETASLASSGLGDHADALAFANEATRRAPLRESAHRCRMKAHIAAGNRAEALRAYQRLRRSLADELGVDPAPETEAAYLELLGSPASVAVPARDEPADRSPASDPPFVGREAELAVLAEAWAGAAGGSGATVLVTGEAGIGKTRLAAEAARRVAQEGGLVLVGRCDRGSIVPYQPFTEALGGYLAATPPDSLPPLAPATRRELATLFPPGGAHRRPGSPADKAALLAALSDVMVAAAGSRPVLAVFDDLHQADTDTLLLLQHVLRRGTGSALLVVATASDDATPAAPFADAVHQLERDGALHRLPLAGLGETDVRALARHFLPGALADARPRPHALVKDTGGNPFLVVELLRAQRTAGVRPWHRPDPPPRKIVQYAAARVASLDPTERDLLRAAAVAGPAFELDLVAHAAGVAPEDVLDTLDGLLAAGLVTDAPGTPPARPHRHRFAHDVVRRAVYEQLSEARRRALHTRLAEAVEQLRAGELDDYSRALADHRAAGAAPWGDRRAVHWGWLAAARAADSHEPTEAVRLYQGALDHVPVDDHELRAEALTKLGLAQARAGQPDGDRSLLDGAIQAGRCGRLDIAAQAAIGLGELVAARPRLRSEAVALIADILDRVGTDHLAGRARQRVPGSVDELAMARLLARYAHLGGPVPPATATTSAALRALGQGLQALAGPDHIEHRLTLAGELFALASAARNTRYRVVAAHNRAMAAEMSGEGPAREDALAALAAAAGESHLFGDALLADHAVAVAVAQGRFTDAATTARLASSLACHGPDEIAPAPGSVPGRQMLVAAWLRANRWPSDDPCLTGPRHAADTALAALIDGERGRAHLTVRALATGAQPLPPGDEWLHVLGVMAVVAAEVGDPTTAEAVRDRLTPYAHLNCGLGYRSFVGPASFHLGRLAIAVGDWAEAERHLTAAVRLLTARRAHPWIVVAQHALARALEARGRPSDRRSARALRAEARWSATRHGIHGHRRAETA